MPRRATRRAAPVPKGHRRPRAAHDRARGRDPLARGEGERVNGPLTPAAASELEVATRHALLHILEDLQRERDGIRAAHREWMHTVDAVRDPMVVLDIE